jgi:hypothetical protein
MNPDSPYHKNKKMYQENREKWLKTEKGKEYLRRNRHRYKTSEKGKISSRAQRKRYSAMYPEKIKANNLKYNQSPHTRYLDYKSHAKRLGRAFNLSEIEFMTFWNRNCYYCGDPVNGIGIDRVDSSLGYFLGNAVSCCKNCNFGKRLLTKDEFINLCKKVVKLHGG